MFVYHLFHVDSIIGGGILFKCKYSSAVLECSCLFLRSLLLGEIRSKGGGEAQKLNQSMLFDLPSIV